MHPENFCQIKIIDLTILLLKQSMKLKFHKIKAIIILFFFFSLISCQKKIKYHQGFNLVWENDSINWNVSSLMINDGYIYGNSLNDKIF